MARSVLLQDWIMIKGTSGTSIPQAVQDYQDLEDGIDVTFLLEVADCAGTALSISYQTSPCLDDRLFRTMDNVAISSAGITQTIVRQATATNPLHRWVRWSVYASTNYSLTFRVWMSVRER